MRGVDQERCAAESIMRRRMCVSGNLRGEGESEEEKYIYGGREGEREIEVK